MSNEQPQQALWDNQRIRERIDALTPGEADMGELEYWNTLRDLALRVGVEISEEYESVIHQLGQANDRLFTRAATRLAELKEVQAERATLTARVASLEQQIEDHDEVLRTLDSALQTIAELEQRLAQAQGRWEPLPDGDIGWGRSLAANGSILHMEADGMYGINMSSVRLPEGVRLCRWQEGSES